MPVNLSRGLLKIVDWKEEPRRIFEPNHGSRPVLDWTMNSKFSNSGAPIIIGVALALRHLRRRPIRAYAVATLLIGFASLLQWELREQYAGAPFLIIYPAVILATLAGGFGAGLFSAILAGASQFGLFIPYFGWVSLGTYAFDAAVCVVLTVAINGTLETFLTHDALTGLPNRTLLGEGLERALKKIHRGERIAILHIHLDHLERVSQMFGYSVGDKLIQDAANRLRGCVRDIDFVFRLIDDEFAIIGTQLENLSDVEELAVRAGEAIREPFRLNGHEIKVDASIGISIAPDDASDVNELLKDAHIALVEAKSVGCGTHCFYRVEMNERMQRRSKLVQELQSALVNGEFELFYQPIFSLEEGRIKTFEALVRWRHPERGMISPSEFIPIAEETGFIVPLGEWVLRTACAEAAKWSSDIKVATNVSAVQLASGALINVVGGALRLAGLSPGRLIIEITESVFLENKSSTVETLSGIHKFGVEISLDDFGTGYSALGYLLSFPFSKIKIDRTFIAGLPDTRESKAIVRAIADLARCLDIKVVAEGVETVEQKEEARILGCTDIQGYFISVPVRANEVRDLLWTYELNAVSPRRIA